MIFRNFSALETSARAISLRTSVDSFLPLLLQERGVESHKGFDGGNHSEHERCYAAAHFFHTVDLRGEGSNSSSCDWMRSRICRL